MALITVIVPLFNEEEYLSTLIQRVLESPLPAGCCQEIIIVDDGSTDGSEEVANRLAEERPAAIRVFHHGINRGKGAAIRTALEHAKGEFCIIQDADLEYDPRDYEKLLTPLLEDRADVVYGSRFMNAGERRVLYFWHSLANKILTQFCNILADLNLTDLTTCYKAFRTSLLKSVPLRCNRFGFEPEVTMKVAKRQARLYETCIRYYGRTYEEGKKVRMSDAFTTAWVLFRNAFTNDLYSDRGAHILDGFSIAGQFNAWMADTIRPYVGQNVLEIGAGMGNLTRQLAGRRKRYVATDLDTEHMARLRSRLHHRPNLTTAICDLSRASDLMPFYGQMDTVVCLNVLEHVEDDLGGLRNIYSSLSDGGRAIVLVPHGQEIFGRLDEVLGHYRRYSHEQLRARMEEAGFRIEKILEFNRVSRPGWYLNGKLLKKDRITRMQLQLFDRTVWLWRKLDHWIPWSPTSIIAIGVKGTAALPWRPDNSAFRNEEEFTAKATATS